MRTSNWLSTTPFHAAYRLKQPGRKLAAISEHHRVTRRLSPGEPSDPYRSCGGAARHRLIVVNIAPCTWADRPRCVCGRRFSSGLANGNDVRLLLIVLLAATSVSAQHTDLKLDTDITKVNFTVRDVLHTVHGTFKLTKGDLWFDPASYKAGGTLVVNATSGNSGSHARDSRMNKNVLQSDTYQEITFTPDRIIGTVNLSGHSEFKLHGMFAIHGAAHELIMNVKADITGNRLTATADFNVPYVKWGLKNPSTLFLRVNDTVPVEIDAVGEIKTL